MKKICTLALSILLCAACSKESKELNPDDSVKKKVSVKIALPVNQVVSFDTKSDYQIATEPEVTVKQLDVYLFGEEGGSYTLEKIYKNVLNDNTFQPTDTEDSKSFSLEVEGVNAKYFYFIANGTKEYALETVSPGVTTQADFKALLTNAISGTSNLIVCDENNQLVMTEEVALPAAELAEDNPSLGDLILRRVVARIDLKSEEDNLQINKITMYNARSTSFIIPNTAPYTSSSEVTLPSAAFTPVNGVAEYNSLFYPYECASDDNEAYLLVEGVLYKNEAEEFEGIRANFEIPFVDEEGNKIAIERNKRYIVTIEDAFQDRVHATFNVVDWVSGEENEHEVTTDIIRISGTNVSGNVLSISAAETTEVLAVSSRTAWTVTKLPAWIEATPGIGSVAKTLTLKVGENEGAAREGIVTLTSNADKDVVCNLVVKQEAAAEL